MANSRKIANAIFLIERHPPQAALRRRCPTRSACRGLTPVATKKERQADAGLSFLAGAEGLSLACRLGRFVACVPLARTRPSARGFGVDVGTAHSEQGEGGVGRFPPQVPERVVLVWCWEKFSGTQKKSNRLF